MKSIASTNIGMRTINEDAFYEGQKLYIMCDGVGGLPYGEVASALACSAIADYLTQCPTETLDRPDLENLLSFIKKAFESKEAQYPEIKGMATTVVLVYFTTRGAYVAWIGDSRMYHLRDGEICFVTEDHSLVNELAKQHKDTTHIGRNYITKSLHATTIDSFSSHYILAEDVQKDDFFFLCTDGVLENIDDSTLASLFRKEQSIADIKAQILDKCAQKTKDNFTFEIIQIN